MKKRKLKIRWTCSDFVKHSHRWKWSVWLCGRWQYLIALFGRDKIYNVDKNGTIVGIQSKSK
jgi:hypothetical protein